MKIKRLELVNFRCFEHLVLEDIPDTVILVARNGAGKSSLLDAILGAKELARPYHRDSWNSQETYKSRTALKWPDQNRPPLRLGTTQGRVRIDFALSECETAHLASKGINSDCYVDITIERDDLVTERTLSKAGQELLGFNSPSTGIGFLDYITALRFFQKTTIGSLGTALSDQNIRTSIGGFHQRPHEQTRWTHFKSYVAACEMSDLSHLKTSGDLRDSLWPFKSAFNALFAPKQFLGVQQNKLGEASVAVKTAELEHDIDLLSDGEKELVYILGHLFRFSSLENTILWDTPEAHLNATLESKLLHALKQVSPHCQYWIATHSIELIGSTPLESLFVLKNGDRGVTCDRPNGPEREHRLRLYEELGASIGVQLASRLVVLVEGQGKYSDKAILDTIFTHTAPGCTFVAAQSSTHALSSSDRLQSLLREIGGSGNLGVLLDRDYRDDQEIDELTSKYDRLFFWPVHELENIFIHSDLLSSVLRKVGVRIDVPDVTKNLRLAAEDIAPWVAADWCAWDLERAATTPKRFIRKEAAVEDLKAYSERLSQNRRSNSEGKDICGLYESKLETVDGLIRDGSYIKRMPGKQLLSTFAGKVGCPVKPQIMLSIAASAIKDGEFTPSPIKDLERWIEAQLIEEAANNDTPPRRTCISGAAKHAG